MLFQSILIGLVAVFMVLDSRMLGRLNFERPLITCTIVGLIMGNVETGLLVGAQMEMITLGMMSIGASGVDMNIGAITGCALVITSGASIETALTIAVPMTLLDQLLTTVADIIRIQLCHMCDGYVEKSQYAMARRVHILFGPLVYSVFKFIPVFFAVYFGNDLINTIVNAVPEFIMSGVSLGANLISFFGFAMLLSTMINKKNAVFFFLGFVIAAYSGLGLTAIAVISIVVTVLLYQIKFGNSSSSLQAAGADIDELDELDDELDD
ncbi:PTS mannose/fructose/sorbose/N-acetylgalactosamine transporter subunit IIC [Candidatus Stoquefichus massiliensis]|uniref:PTS mannose/fructose/sorbose/N-acetylgalactosamine transporter subunit IIC n=1 Tax=Candidatus Stoquefichus massiliensis TaxID=1470350 RepID=UPI000489CC34|nr:PTS sugar transporter subunit IIC [Candidatus Stoquefichus massiliensis]